jgi:hypothetical protein
MLYKQPTTEQSDRLFILPLSYYVKIIGSTDTHYAVEYQENSQNYYIVPGYVLRNKLTPEGSVPQTPFYASKELSVTTFSTILKKSNVSDSSSENTVLTLFQDYKINYYGHLPSVDGGEWYFVKYQGYFGYVKGTDISAADIPMHPTPMPDPPEPSVSPSAETGGETPLDGSLIRLILILGISIPAIIIVILLFKPNRPAPAVSKGSNRQKRSEPSFYEEFDDFDDF